MASKIRKATRTPRWVLLATLVVILATALGLLALGLLADRQEQEAEKYLSGNP